MDSADPAPILATGLINPMTNFKVMLRLPLLFVVNRTLLLF
jgi:hypothetical protein